MNALLHEGLRTRAAKLAAAALALKRAGVASAPFCLAFLTDRRRIENPEPILRALPAGSAVIFRDYDAPRREAIARRYLSICRARGVLFLVAGDGALGRRIGADGVHWPAPFPSLEKGGLSRTISPFEIVLARKGGFETRVALLGPNPPVRPSPAASAAGASRPPFSREGGLLITAACHSAADLARAHRLGAHLALLSPVFPTPSHPGAEHLGPERFKALAAASPIPVLALGGVDEKNAPLLAGRTIAGIAAIGAFEAGVRNNKAPSTLTLTPSPRPPVHSRTDR